MNKLINIENEKEYIAELEKALKKLSVSDIDEIIEEYQQHFEYKHMDGFSETEIIAKLGAPQIIAQQFAEGGKKHVNTAKITFVCLLDVCVILLGILLFSWVIVLGAAAIAFTATGFCLIIEWKIIEFIPTPYFGSLFMAIVCFALGVISSIGSIYSFLYIRQWIRMYVRWHKNQFNKGRYPNLSNTPIIDVKLNRRFRLVTVIALMITGGCLILGYVSMAISANNLEFWHVWGWFV